MNDARAPQILILDDDAAHGASVQLLLQAHGINAESTTDAPRAMQRLAAGEFQVLLLDINMPQISGIDVLEFLTDHHVDVKTIVLSGESSVSSVAPILRLGACDYLTKPYAPERLLTSVANALERHRLEHENRDLAARAQADHELHQFLVTASPDLIYVLDGEGRFTFANKPVCDLIDTAPADVKGLPWTDVLGPDLAHSLRHHFNERRTGVRATRHFEFEYKPGSADTRLLEVSATGLYDEQASYRFLGTYGVLRDVTEARRTALELAQNRTKFYGLFMDSPEASYIARLRDGQLIEANASFRAIQMRLGADFETTDAFLFPDGQTRFEFVRRVAAGGEVKTIAIDRENADDIYPP
jgi:PAS domain S-box-containing protein